LEEFDFTLMTRVIKLDYGIARELAKFPQNKQEQAYHLAQKMAEQDRRSISPAAYPAGLF